MGREGLK
jgi:hypothetical protein